MDTEVVVIGGGATGAGVLRDLALRGIDAVLLEKNEPTSGTSGRNHGLLHSGARYAVRDPDSARDCLSENLILKKIASPCLEDTGGFFVSLPEDPQEYLEQLLRACDQLAIPAKKVPVADVLQKEPSLSPRITGALWVPDGAIDPFRLIRANLEEAARLGAKVIPFCEVVAVHTHRGSIRGICARNSRTGAESEIGCRFIVNAAGAWAGKVARLAGASLELIFSKGSLVVFSRRLVNSVLNRSRPPSNGDIFVPHGPALILGTTSCPTADIEDPAAEEKEVNLLFGEGEKMIPEVASARAIRAFAGVRPLMSAGGAQEDGRTVSRDFLLRNHGEGDGVKGLFSIAGGKLTTYRLMAERTVDALCREMGEKAPCLTAKKPLPFPKEYHFRQLGSRMQRITAAVSPFSRSEILCECELVTKGEVLEEIRKLSFSSLRELQERTRAGMGPCQGGFCSPRLTALLSETGKIPLGSSLSVLKGFLEERWKGTRPVLWGPQLREEQLIQSLYAELFNLDHM